MKFDTKYGCNMLQVTYTVTQSIVTDRKAKNVLLVSITWEFKISLRRKKMFSTLEQNRRPDSKTSR